MYCNNCGTQNPDSSTFCGKCGNRLAPAQAQVQPCPTVVVPARKTNGMAIASLVTGIAGFFTGITSILAIIFGAVALNQIKKDPSQDGKGMAIAGIILGSIVLFLAILAIIFIIIVAATYSSSTSDFWVSTMRFATAA
jgi:hypothetical protein